MIGVPSFRVSFTGADPLAVLVPTGYRALGSDGADRWQVFFGPVGSGVVAYVTAAEARDVVAAWAALATDLGLREAEMAAQAVPS